MKDYKLVYVTRRTKATAPAEIGWLNMGYDGNTIFRPTDSLVRANLVLLPEGGTQTQNDVNPEWYHDESHKFTRASEKEDTEDFSAVYEALKMKIPVLGIERGAHVLTVCAGGKVIQNVNDHGDFSQGNNKAWKGIPDTDFHHEVRLFNNKYMTVSSKHKGMMYPFNVPLDHYRILAWARSQSKIYEGGGNFKLVPPTEANFFRPHKKLNKKGVVLRYIYRDEESERMFPDRSYKLMFSTNMRVEPEIVEYPRLAGLALQFNPNLMKESFSRSMKVTQLMTRKFLEKYES